MNLLIHYLCDCNCLWKPEIEKNVIFSLAGISISFKIDWKFSLEVEQTLTHPKQPPYTLFQKLPTSSCRKPNNFCSATFQDDNTPTEMDKTDFLKVQELLHRT